MFTTRLDTDIDKQISDSHAYFKAGTDYDLITKLVSNDFVEAKRLISENKERLYIKNRSDQTSLMFICERKSISQNDVEGAKIIIEALKSIDNPKITINQYLDHYDSSGYTALILVCKSTPNEWSAKMIDLLVSSGASINFATSLHGSPLVNACDNFPSNGQNYNTQQLLSYQNIDLNNGFDAMNHNPLNAALVTIFHESEISSNGIELIKSLIDKKVNVNHIPHYRHHPLSVILGDTLHYSYNRCDELIDILMDAGSRIPEYELKCLDNRNIEIYKKYLIAHELSKMSRKRKIDEIDIPIKKKQKNEAVEPHGPNYRNVNFEI